MTDEAALVSVSSDTSMSLTLGGRPASGWRCAFLLIGRHKMFRSPEILGFGPSGNLILPNTHNSMDPDVIRREKLGWDQISIQASKIVSLIGVFRLHNNHVIS